MNGGMLSPSQSLQVLQPVVQRVAVDVVNDHASRHRTVGRFVDDTRPFAPHVRLSDLHPRPGDVVAIVSLSNAYVADRRPVVWPDALLEFSVRRTPPTHVDARKRIVRSGRAFPGAVVDRPKLCPLLVELGATHGAIEHLPGLPDGLIGHNRQSIAGTGTTFDQRNRDLYPARRAECAKSLFGTQPEIPGQLDMFGGDT